MDRPVVLGVPSTPADVDSREVAVLYSPALAERILDLYIEGHSLHAISGFDGMPSYTTILRWVRDSGKLAEEFDRARQVRALHFEDQALQIATGAIDKDDAPGERLRFDVYKWGAEVSDPSRFGKKVTISGGARPIVFEVRSGVPEPAEHQASVELGADGMQVVQAAVVEESE